MSNDKYDKTIICICPDKHKQSDTPTGIGEGKYLSEVPTKEFKKEFLGLSATRQRLFLSQQIENNRKDLSELRQINLELQQRINNLENSKKKNSDNDFKIALEIIKCKGYFDNSDFNNEDFKGKYEKRQDQSEFRKFLLNRHSDLTSFENTNDRGSPVWICRKDNLENIMGYAKLKPKKDKHKSVGKETDIEKVGKVLISKYGQKTISIYTINRVIQRELNLRHPNAIRNFAHALSKFGVIKSVGGSNFLVSQVMPQ